LHAVKFVDAVTWGKGSTKTLELASSLQPWLSVMTTWAVTAAPGTVVHAVAVLPIPLTLLDQLY